ncbi:hypothetical protein GCM10009798_15400 [Nocardioides panacihumi]|uniref:J domain-containing protein n=1 Tax=Nocardioides panacihumi TaxID=400774 RepID=A0ABN2QRK3_9ACTN
MSSAPTWYDVLDVEPSASTDQIRTAWKAAVADLDPTDRRFQRLSEAAAVLLDDERRAEYDASRVGISRVGGNGPERSEDRLVPTRRPGRLWRRDRAATSDLPAGAAASAVGDVPATEPGISGIEPAPALGEPDETVPRPGPTLRPVPLWVLGVAAVVALVLVCAAAFAWTRPDPKAIESDADAARAAAERAVVPVLSYDYRSLDQGQKQAESWLTPHYRDKDYRPLFATIKTNAPGTRAVVTTKVVESAIVRAGQDRVEVLLLVDRPTTNAKQTTPITYEDHVTVTMEKGGDGWLIDDMST